MVKTNLLKRLIIVAVLSTATMTAFAQDAPVYDADNYPPQFDGQSDVGAANNDADSQTPSQVQTYAAPSASSAAPVSPAPSNLSIEQRMSRAEQQINNMQSSNSSAEVDSLHKEIQGLRGQVDVLTHQLQQMQNQQKTMYSDFDKRLNKQQTSQPASVAAVSTADSANSDMEDVVKQPVAKKKVVAKAKLAAPAPAVDQAAADDATTANTPADPPVSKPVAQPNVAEEQQVYQTAYDLIKTKKYDQAITSLKTMLNKYPSGQFAANAHYWLGELYGLQNKNDQSAVEFASVVKNYPDSPKVSDAQLKLGLISAAQFKWTDAKSAFKKVINHYPGTASARLASEQLKQIKLAGH